jgi:hypothetical protein
MDLARKYLKPLADGNKIASFDLLGGGFQTFGNVYYVVPSTEANYSVLQKMYDIVYDDGSKAFCTTVAEAYGKTVSGRDDVIVLSCNVTHQILTMLTVSKNRVHFVGDTWGRVYGQRAKVNYADAIATADPFMIKVTGVGNTFTGIKFLNNNTDAQVVATVGEGGEYTVYTNCEIYNSTNLDSDTVSEMVLNGDSTQFYGCTFGSLADAVSGDKVRPAILLTKGTVGTGLVCRDVYFDKCRFWKQAGGTTTAMVKGGATDVERIMEFHDCAFIANVLGAVPAVAIDVATLTVGQIILSGDTYASECTKIATATGVLNATPARVATATIAIQAT